MLTGYWDGRGFDQLIPGSAATQTSEVNAAIASSQHYSDYCLPSDDSGILDYAPGPILKDRSEPPIGDEHPDNCIADLMLTSRSVETLHYGETRIYDVPDGLADYYSLNGYRANSELWIYGQQLTWDSFRGQINMDCPVVLFVDTDSNGYADHAVTAVGYRDGPGIREYLCYDTWGLALEAHTFAGTAPGRPWGIKAAATLDFGQVAVSWIAADVGTQVYPFKLSWSSDGGQSFGPEVEVPGARSYPAMSDIEVTESGRVYFVVQGDEETWAGEPGDATRRSWIEVWRSDDGGANFSGPVVVAEATREEVDFVWHGTALLAPSLAAPRWAGPSRVAFADVPVSFWAAPDIRACFDESIVAGYEDDTYRPELTVTRDQMAVYIARALAVGEDRVPAADAWPVPTFTDVPVDHWAYRYVEYAHANGVVQGFPGGYYRPSLTLTRDQMAVYIARSIVTPTGEAGLADYTPPATPTFPDVSNTGYGSDGTEPFWAYKHIEYCVGQGVVRGYGDGLYHPELVVTRDQVAVYVSRSFKLMRVGG
jgi:hypothetical protein